jgi:anti-sigma B factor antagonist
VEFQIESQSGRVSVAGDMTVYCASELKPALLLEAAAAHNSLELDLAQVQELDTAGLQLLLLLNRELQGRLRIVACSPGVRAVLQLTHLNRLLGADTSAAEAA